MRIDPFLFGFWDHAGFVSCRCRTCRGKTPFLGAPAAQPAERDLRIGENPAPKASDHRCAVTPPEDLFGLVFIAGGPAIGRCLDSCGGLFPAGFSSRGEIGIALQPAIERRGAYREEVGERGIVHAETAGEPRVADEVGLVVRRAGHADSMAGRQAWLNRGREPNRLPPRWTAFPQGNAPPRRNPARFW